MRSFITRTISIILLSLLLSTILILGLSRLVSGEYEENDVVFVGNSNCSVSVDDYNISCVKALNRCTQGQGLYWSLLEAQLAIRSGCNTVVVDFSPDVLCSNWKSRDLPRWWPYRHLVVEEGAFTGRRDVGYKFYLSYLVPNVLASVKNSHYQPLISQIEKKRNFVNQKLDLELRILQNFLKRNQDIDLKFIYSPKHSQYVEDYTVLDGEYYTIVEEIRKYSNVEYHDFSRELSDKYFVDLQHLSLEGSMYYTDLVEREVLCK